ncbi:unnamed protein product [Paramecium sonneborni]|uniref:Uncharacterized protein n=1 Tax=Paramecium sonneborni TaxID=65129 RepID=A0A8S1RSQ4_9CILI|nr:unnamed protein product [Paramecium sonneborni]
MMSKYKILITWKGQTSQYEWRRNKLPIHFKFEGCLFYISRLITSNYKGLKHFRWQINSLLYHNSCIHIKPRENINSQHFTYLDTYRQILLNEQRWIQQDHQFIDQIELYQQSIPITNACKAQTLSQILVIIDILYIQVMAIQPTRSTQQFMLKENLLPLKIFIKQNIKYTVKVEQKHLHHQQCYETIHHQRNTNIFIMINMKYRLNSSAYFRINLELLGFNIIVVSRSINSITTSIIMIYQFHKSFIFK